MLAPEERNLYSQGSPDAVSSVGAASKDMLLRLTDIPN
jgi:hypothetical protein